MEALDLPGMHSLKQSNVQSFRGKHIDADCFINRCLMDISTMYAALYAAAEINTDCPRPAMPDIIEQIRQASASMEMLQKNLEERFANSEDVLVQQIVQQTSAISGLLSKQSQMLESWQKKFGGTLEAKCSSDMKEIEMLAEQINTSMKNTLDGNDSSDAIALNDLAAKAFSGATRLNLMQQRISGKMRKVR